MQIYGEMKGAGVVVLGDHNRTDTEDVLRAEAARKGELNQPYYKPQIK